MAGGRKAGGVGVLPSPASFHPMMNGSSSNGRTNGCHGSSASHPALLSHGQHHATGGYGIGSPNGYGQGTGKEYGSGYGNGLAKCHEDSDDDDEFYGAEERSTCSDSDFQDARDADFSSDSEGSASHTPRHQGGYRSLLLKLQEEQSKRVALEALLQTERQRVLEMEQAASQKSGKNGPKPDHSGEANDQGVAASEEKQDASSQTRESLDCSAVKLIVARMVSEAVGRAAARAEAVLELEAQLQKKEQEVARLREKLQYWERMNQEMSQQNTHAIEYLRQRRRVLKSVYRGACLIGAVGLCVGMLVALSTTSSSHSEQSPAAQEG